jgi:hypothetical protein
MTDPTSQQQGWQQPTQQPGYPQSADQQYTAPQYPVQQPGYPQHPAQQSGYPQYPAQQSGSPQYAAQQSLPPRPNTLTIACGICFAGGALDLIFLIVGHGAGGGEVASSLIGIALWFLVGGFCLRGQNWARVTGTVAFGFNCLGTILLVVLLAEAISVVNQANGDTGGVFSGFASISSGILYLLLTVVIVLWLIGLSATVLLWRKESSAYFKAISARSQSPAWQVPPQMPQQ